MTVTMSLSLAHVYVYRSPMLRACKLQQKRDGQHADPFAPLQFRVVGDIQFYFLTTVVNNSIVPAPAATTVHSRQCRHVAHCGPRPSILTVFLPLYPSLNSQKKPFALSALYIESPASVIRKGIPNN